MNKLKIVITRLVIFVLLCSLFVGCSKTAAELNQSPTTKPENTSMDTKPRPPNEKTNVKVNENDLNIPKDNTTKKSSSILESWLGEYKFSEYAPSNQNMFYRISISKVNNSYYAQISIDGFQTIERLQAKVSGDENSIQLIFEKYLPDNQFETYAEGDILLSFQKENFKLYTSWGKIQPMLDSNNKSSEVYFEIAP